jgi:hypothetical protein
MFLLGRREEKELSFPLYIPILVVCRKRQNNDTMLFSQEDSMLQVSDTMAQEVVQEREFVPVFPYSSENVCGKNVFIQAEVREKVVNERFWFDITCQITPVAVQRSNTKTRCETYVISQDRSGWFIRHDVIENFHLHVCSLFHVDGCNISVIILPPITEEELQQDVVDNTVVMSYSLKDEAVLLKACISLFFQTTQDVRSVVELTTDADERIVQSATVHSDSFLRLPRRFRSLFLRVYSLHLSCA